MDLSHDRFPIVCKSAREDALGCEGTDALGVCKIFTNAGVKAKERTGCAYKGFRTPEPTLKNVKKVRVGQQKQAKRKEKAGEKAVEKA